MASNLVRIASRCAVVPKRAIATTVVKGGELTLAERELINPRIGDRDVVGYGFNGTASYMDRPEFPFPAIRFGKNTPEVMALREKEKGDWKNLTIEEKKMLYRASFCQTYAEIESPTADWRFITGGVLIGLSLAGMVCVFVKRYVYNPLPKTITEEWAEADLQRRVVERTGAIDGATREYFQK